MKIFQCSLFPIFCTLIASTLFSQNVVIDSGDNNPNEPSIMFDPIHPEKVVVGANLDNYYVSADTGRTWTVHKLTSEFGVWGDPVIDVDINGDFYFFHLSNPDDGNWVDRIVCQKSSDSGNTWSSGTYAGLNNTKIQDKQWSAIDRTDNSIYICWTQFDDYDSSSPTDSSTILFSKSTDAGNTWSEPLRISRDAGDCLDNDNTVEGAVPAIGPNGEIFVAWAGPNGIVFNRSYDAGETWLDQEILVDDMPGGWAYDIPGISRCNGLPVTKCDTSGGPNNGTIYVNWTDQRFGADDTDVWLVKSTDDGNTWTDPIRVNDDDAGNQQFLTWMDIDQTNGNLYFVFYDRRNYDDIRTDVYVAMSDDGGISFLNKCISETPFVPSGDIFFGDYTNIFAHNGVIRPVWTRLNNGELSLVTDVSDEVFYQTVDVQESKAEDVDAVQYPNIVSNMSYVSFKLHKLSEVTLEVFDNQGRFVANVIDKEKKTYGKYIIPIDVKDYGLITGTYYSRLTIDGVAKTMRMVVVEE